MSTVFVKDLVGSNAISMNSGGKLREIIVKEWAKNEKIALDFSGVDVFASPFFNASVGALLKDRSIEELQGKLIFEGVSDHGRRLLNLVISNAIKFYSDRDNKTNEGLDKISEDI